MKCKLITNNTLLKEYSESHPFKIEELIFIQHLEIQEVFSCVRDYVHKGHKLLTHPLSGSVKPEETPFKSIAISVEATALDVESLLIIEDAIIMAKNFSRGEKRSRSIPSQILDDFRLIDFGLIKSGLEAMNNS